MRAKQVLTTRRAVEIFEEMLSCRREYCADKDFFRMPAVWKDLCDEEGRWTINLYRSTETEDYKRKAGVIAFADKVTLTVDERLWANAKQGCKLANFMLAHELGHVALGHHAKGAVTKNFQLFSDSRGMMANLPPTLEEKEANYAAFFFQCGVALLDPRWGSRDLANRAFCDENSVKNAQKMVRLDVFQRELHRPRPIHPRVIL